MYIVKVWIEGFGEGGAHHGSCGPSLHRNSNLLNEVMVGVWLPCLLPIAATKVYYQNLPSPTSLILLRHLRL